MMLVNNVTDFVQSNFYNYNDIQDLDTFKKYICWCIFELSRFNPNIIKYSNMEMKESTINNILQFIKNIEDEEINSDMVAGFMNCFTNDQTNYLESIKYQFNYISFINDVNIMQRIDSLRISEENNNLYTNLNDENITKNEYINTFYLSIPFYQEDVNKLSLINLIFRKITDLDINSLYYIIDQLFDNSVTVNDKFVNILMSLTNDQLIYLGI